MKLAKSNYSTLLALATLLLTGCSTEPMPGESEGFDAWENAVDGTATITKISDQAISFDWQADEFPEDKQTVQDLDIKDLIGQMQNPQSGQAIQIRRIDLYEQTGTTTPKHTGTVWSLE